MSAILDRLRENIDRNVVPEPLPRVTDLPTQTEKKLKAMRTEANENRQTAEATLNRQITRLNKLRAKNTDLEMAADYDDLETDSREQYATVMKAYAVTERAIRLAAEEALANNIDIKTGLELRRSGINYLCSMLAEWQNNPEEYDPRNIRLLMTDMMFFHLGNDVLGYSGFDDRIGLLASGYKAVAMFLSKGEASDPYGKLKPDTDLTQILDRYFPPGSPPRALLEDLRSKGMSLGTYRISAGGGDEFVHFLVGKNKTVTEEDFQKLETVIKYITGNTTLSPRAEEAIMQEEKPIAGLQGKELERRQSAVASLKDAFREIKPSHTLDPAYEFADQFEDYLLEKAEASLRPETNVHMDYAECKFKNGAMPTLEDAVLMFFTGKDSREEQRIMEGGRDAGFYNATGEINTEILDRYVSDLYQRAYHRCQGDLARIEDMAKTIMFEDVSGNMLSYLNDQVNEEGKRIKKRDYFLEALVEMNPAMLLALGENKRANRSVLPHLNGSDKLIMMRELSKRVEAKLTTQARLTTTETYLLARARELNSAGISFTLIKSGST